jgi:hypothetical protein
MIVALLVASSDKEKGVLHFMTLQEAQKRLEDSPLSTLPPYKDPFDEVLELLEKRSPGAPPKS